MGRAAHPRGASRIEEREIPRLAEWPGPDWLVTDIGLELVQPEVGVETVVVMAARPARRF